MFEHSEFADFSSVLIFQVFWKIGLDFLVTFGAMPKVTRALALHSCLPSINQKTALFLGRSVSFPYINLTGNSSSNQGRAAFFKEIDTTLGCFYKSINPSRFMVDMGNNAFLSF